MTTSQSDDKPRTWNRCIVILIVGLVAAAVVWFVCRTLEDWYTIGADPVAWEIRGTRGDFWGGHLAPIIGLLSFLLMFAALLLQTAELKEQRRDIKKTGEAAKSQARSLDEHTVELRQQNNVAQFQADIAFLDLLASRVLVVDNRRMKAVAVLNLAAKTIVYRAKSDPERALDMVEFFEVSIVLGGRVGQSVMTALEHAVEIYAPELGKRSDEHQLTWLAEATSRVQAAQSPWDG
jgi:hypothetical protein